MVLVILVALGLLPRTVVLWDAAVLAIYLIAVPLDEGLIFFIRSIPLFIAIPFTASFDNFNMWRIFALILFIKWFVGAEARVYLKETYRKFFRTPWQAIKENKLFFSFKLLGLLALLSLIMAPDKAAGIKRIIFFINAGVIGWVIWEYGRRSKDFLLRAVKNITIPVIIVTLVGLIQLLSTYFMDIYQFMRLWGEGIDLRLFGATWSYIAVHVGNTWFAYFGDQLSLRVFSLFPDSHSFPIFLLLGLPAFFAWTLQKPLAKSESLKAMFHTRGKIAVLWIPLIFLMAILSGTRGIWAGAVAALVWAGLVWLFMRQKKVSSAARNSFAYLTSYLAIFFLLFMVALPIFASPQFLVSKNNSLLLEHRLASIVDFGETSNSQRLEIWKDSLTSIIHKPILGVGIGNFPVVLGQNIELAKAGSSAHNIYLHIAAEMGILALLVALCVIWLIIRQTYRFATSAQTESDRGYAAGLLITIPWVFAYLMTDVALFDERALLLFVVTLGLLFAYER
ncbi:MAG TPA: O-antigen ligase family protein [Candidatus Paceibacterota bacterium]|nr:O-antigen ligase family protein [Candidatus Paceibacterota bacterium]